MKKKLSLLVLSLGLAGCASYESQPLSNLTLETALTSHKNGEVVAVAKTFDKSECKRYLDRDVIAEGYLPVQLYIQNNTDKSYYFSLNRMSVPFARAEEVAEKVHTSTVGRAVGYGAAALVLWPFAIPAIVDGIKSAKANENLDVDFSAKTARDQTIAPHSHLNKIIFVPSKQYESQFTVTLIDQQTNEPKILKLLAN